MTAQEKREGESAQTPMPSLSDSPKDSSLASPAPRSELLMLIVIACMNFCHIVDFMIVMPLGPQFMRIFSIDASRFGFLVSAYSFSAAAAGFLGAFIIDKFDRRQAMLVVFVGFMIGTAACALAPSYSFLLAARIIAGAFGGLTGAIIFAIIGDVVPAHRRGQATGIVMAAFALASIAGIPLGLWLATNFSWHAPFTAIVAVSFCALVLGFKVLPPVRGHLTRVRHTTPWQDINTVLTERVHQRAFLLMVCLMFGGFSVIPFISTYLVANAGIPESSLQLVYLCGGAATLISSPLFGRMADRFGSLRVFSVLMIVSLFPLLALTNLPSVPLWLSLVVSTSFMTFVSGRAIVAVNLINSAVLPAFRGSFMSINASVQQMSAGLASFAASLLVVQTPGSPMTGYATVGLLACACSIATLFIAPKIQRPLQTDNPLKN
jgi:predicted MFS family arabinose efflux permease